uniref:FAD-dependent monooxygenase nodY2 n=1 Tax=Hypoxylon pulicicidum TaxID=1243767 RepID=NODY2_HYPPI|nr:RecName: Full=FAD-dependent monooxygenase nodY2; AltName: Full=Nodulisporic acid biosynthesis cluster protein Y2 [Hypoxylon pulicicidum]AUM60057.1 FAD-dependent oxygenase [Hypoxylon pulicicidum]
MAPDRLGPEGTARPNSSGISVIVVGLGIAGLTAAIECHRKGHSVIAFERMKDVEPFGEFGFESPYWLLRQPSKGDSIIIGSNGGRIFGKWGRGEVRNAMQAWRYTPTHADIYDTAGRFMAQSEIPKAADDMYFTLRGRLAKTFYEHAQSLGIDMRMGSKVTEFWEDSNRAGIVVEGERFEADCVICADGIHSKSRSLFTSLNAQPFRSGFSIFRGKADANAIIADPDAKWILDQTENTDQFKVFLGKEICVVIITCGLGRAVVCSAMHRDLNEAEQSWSTHANPDDLLDAIKDWPCRRQIEPIVRKISEDQFIDYPLLTVSPLDTWVSQHGRMILIGDAAHPFFPTSGQGGAQAMEDAAVLAICLELAGKGNIPLALHATEKIRKSRASVLQLNRTYSEGVQLAPALPKSKDSMSVPNVPVMDWIWHHCCQSYAYDEFDKVAEAIQSGSEYIPHNLPEDGT